ncbi:MAG: chemotaxis protein CheD [Zoogloea oleivorans]|jgi:chemotaxis protein CheD|uniref:Probable chemoreceptor glutamine deamidase CheD n=1 Tax=Zoogloea oleivorans TaxID=1552750 RepID=A0A6C2D2T1_9RHOO|nr:chemotaxis protein CheD [Zoogloea oleivorans]MDY0036482.1 chemotaxis protein CheD [Zoogloea oleivorans]TYC60750.1 chemotaxis protein CheD [Zoogloea oleivorans]
MIEFGDDIREVFLQPGGFHFGGGRTRISTLLGSCISITLWHPARLVGGMCHFMLPSRGQSAGAALDGRYADEALVLFDREVAKAGSRPGDYQVKVFGGGNMLTRADDSSELMDIAARNVESAYALLARHGYRPAALAHCGGKGHRKLIFDLWTGHVWLAHRPLGSVA